MFDYSVTWIFMVDHQVLIFWNLELTESMPCTQRQERSCSSCLRQVLHETHPLWHYIIVSGYCGFYLCFFLVMTVNKSFWRVRQVQTICLLYCVFVVLVLLFLSYLGLRSLSHSLEIFEAKLNHLVSRCKHVLFLTFRSLSKHYVYTISNGLLLNSLKF